MSFSREEEINNHLSEAIEAYDKGDIKTALGKLIWAVGWLADETFLKDKEAKK